MTFAEFKLLFSSEELSTMRRFCERHDTTLRAAQGAPRWSKSRSDRSLRLARSACYAYLKARGWSFPEIGRAWSRDHTSIMAAIEKFLQTEELPSTAERFEPFYDKAMLEAEADRLAVEAAHLRATALELEAAAERIRSAVRKTRLVIPESAPGEAEPEAAAAE